MSGKIFLGILSGERSLFSISRLNTWGRFSRFSYSTAQRIESSRVGRPPFNESRSETNHRVVPTYKEIQSNPELQRRLAEMYASQKKDPEFHKLTQESMKWGTEILGKEKQ